MFEIKSYKCKYCGKKSSRKECRKCIRTHIRPNKSFRKEIKETRMNSNITSAMIREKL